MSPINHHRKSQSGSITSEVIYDIAETLIFFFSYINIFSFLLDIPKISCVFNLTVAKYIFFGWTRFKIEANVTRTDVDKENRRPCTMRVSLDIISSGFTF